MPPTHPDRADAPNLDMAITVARNTALEAGIDRATLEAPGLSIAPARDRRDRCGAFR